MGKEGVILAKKKINILRTKPFSGSGRLSLGLPLVQSGLYRGEVGLGWTGLEEFSFPWEWGKSVPPGISSRGTYLWW